MRYWKILQQNNGPAVENTTTIPRSIPCLGNQSPPECIDTVENSTHTGNQGHI